MTKHRHILMPHCKGGRCDWLVCVLCHGYGKPRGRWAINPYEFIKEP